MATEDTQTGWDVFARAPKVEEFEPSERAKAGEVPLRKTADVAAFGVPLLNPWENECTPIP